MFSPGIVLYFPTSLLAPIYIILNSYIYILSQGYAITNFYLTVEQVSTFQPSVHINNAVVNTSARQLSLHFWFFPKDFWILHVQLTLRPHLEHWLATVSFLEVSTNTRPWLHPRARTRISGWVGAHSGGSGLHHCPRTDAPHLPSWPDCTDMQS